MTITTMKLPPHRAYLMAKNFGLECTHCDYHLEVIRDSSSIDVVVIHERGCRRRLSKTAGLFARFRRRRHVPTRIAKKLQID